MLTETMHELLSAADLLDDVSDRAFPSGLTIRDADLAEVMAILDVDRFPRT